MKQTPLLSFFRVHIGPEKPGKTGKYVAFAKSKGEPKKVRKNPKKLGSFLQILSKSGKSQGKQII